MKTSFWESLIELDKKAFLFLNDLHSPFMDAIMVGISDKLIWIPFYALLLFFVIRFYGKKSVFIVLAVVLLITLCDQFSVHFFKNVFLRLRPCHEADLQGLVHTVNDRCGGKYGFVSSHAANSFGLAYFLSFVLGRIRTFWKPLLIVWAIVVSYSRIYLGVHYPGDVIFGAMLGICIAMAMKYLLIALNAKWKVLESGL